MKATHQIKKWTSSFGQAYTKRNTYSPDELNRLYLKYFGASRTQMQKEFFKGLRIKNVLEVGCNTGNQLRFLKAEGYHNLYGIEPQWYAVEKAKALTKHINIIKGNVFNIPFKDGYFDLVFTAGVLIHISPEDITKALKEVYRVSKKYIWGFEYYADTYTQVTYQGEKDLLWKGDFTKLYRKQFPTLILIKEKKYPYREGDNVDVMFLFKKS